MIDSKGNINWANPMAMTLMPLTFGLAIGMTLWDVRNYRWYQDALKK